MTGNTEDAVDGRALARELVDRFVTQLARELRSSLQTVLSFAELMQDPACSAAQMRVYAAELAQATDGLRLRVLRTLIAFQGELDVEPCRDQPFEPLAGALAKVRGAVTS
jgi:signal transduction histidine kinase